jgi:hypothetical protein
MKRETIRHYRSYTVVNVSRVTDGKQQSVNRIHMF